MCFSKDVHTTNSEVNPKLRGRVQLIQASTKLAEDILLNKFQEAVV